MSGETTYKSVCLFPLNVKKKSTKGQRELNKNATKTLFYKKIKSEINI